MSNQDLIDEINRNVIDKINRIIAKHGLLGTGRTKHKMNLWTPPRHWKGKTVYLFGYTPWKTTLEGKEGYFAFKFRQFKNGRRKLIKAVRFGKRKTAKARATKWYYDYYGRSKPQTKEEILQSRLNRQKPNGSWDLSSDYLRYRREGGTMTVEQWNDRIKELAKEEKA